MNDESQMKSRWLFFIVGRVLWRCLNRHNRPPAKNVRPSKTEKERGRRWRMVHSGPFNGLCEIESSRGSLGISNIFLPMLELLHLFGLLAVPSSCTDLPFPLALKASTSLADLRSIRRISQRLPAEEPQMRADFPAESPQRSSKRKSSTRETTLSKFLRPRIVIFS